MESNGEIRIGFYVCHCGSNIGRVVDVPRVADTMSKMPGVVVSRDYKYMCSEPGQALVEQDIKDHRLNRVVVASCSPLLHEKTFRTAVGRAGLNPFYFQMVNIREHVSWVHEDSMEATEKAIALSRAAIHRVVYHRPLETRRVDIKSSVLIVGGGIAGIHSALKLADAGVKVYLVEREMTIGGHMAKFDKTFPTMDCAACILTPKMAQVREHPNITLWTNSEVTGLDGHVGSFKATVVRHPRYVKEDLCVGCLDCIEGCVVRTSDGRSSMISVDAFRKSRSDSNGATPKVAVTKLPNEFDEGLSTRKPVYIPFPQAVPQIVAVDPNSCLQIKTGKCKQTCVERCERDAFDFTQTDTTEEIEVGAIIVATGFKTFDPHRIPEYHYNDYEEVYTALEVERMVNASGPTGGHIEMNNGQRPKSVGIVHCVGSRDFHYNRWCSRVCCMYSLKLAHLIREHTGAEIYNCYIDMRCPGKGYEEFYDRLLAEGVHFIRGRVAEILDWPMSKAEEGKLVLRVEDTLAGFVRRVPVDMVVLSTGLEPRADSEDVRRLFGISCSTGGFFLEKHPKLAPVETTSDGVYLAGCCQGPKDIPDTVAQAGAAAAEALALISRGYIEMEPNTASIDEEECSGCKSCIGLCPYNAIHFDEEKNVAVIDETLCKGCGTCVAACPSGSIKQNLFEDDQIFAEIEEVLAHV
ncbi:CoB--CoM heterodisulfide reductase iron-sulfur subunit A family protein [bacterium]|nr:CoB--CoM heterodisulfide reductase iron-sulfur subunit A family protein [bacterium]